MYYLFQASNGFILCLIDGDGYLVGRFLRSMDDPFRLTPH